MFGQGASMTVVSLVKHRGRETQDLIASLGVIAEHYGGSVLAVYRSPDGWEKVVASGVFRADTAKALRAAMKISVALTKEEEIFRGEP